jgi:predicted nucleotide-binding protein
MLIKNFRKKCVKKIIEFIDPEYPNETYDKDIISFEDMSAFLQLIAKNKIWKDVILKENEIIVKELANYVSRVNFHAEIKDSDDTYIVNK